MKLRYTTAIVLSMFLSVAAAERGIDAMRGESPIPEEAAPPRMPQVENTDIKRARNYPMQPPTIPHKIDGYQVDLNSNKCLSCHSRRRTEESQAPMVSVTHYMDRDGNFLAEVSPRRYFCNQCHVTQTNARPLVENTFQDVDTILQKRVGAQ
ncbi:MAG: nitrate reductase cytochrome c-type subunit [Gammaproteobacteria bacterium]|nr:nitrate reductase cytochrome c-type subunit [Gammaproteobacteria bacterium]